MFKVNKYKSYTTLGKYFTKPNKLTLLKFLTPMLIDHCWRRSDISIR